MSYLKYAMKIENDRHDRERSIPLIVNFFGRKYLKSAANEGTDVISSKPFIPLWPLILPLRFPEVTTGGEETSQAAAVASRDN